MAVFFSVSYDLTFKKDDIDTRKKVLLALPDWDQAIKKLIDAAGIAGKVPDTENKEELCGAIAEMFPIAKLLDYLYIAFVDEKTGEIHFSHEGHESSGMIDTYQDFFTDIIPLLEDGSTMHTSCDEYDMDETSTLAGKEIVTGGKIEFTYDGDENLDGDHLLPFLETAVATVKAKDKEWRDRTARSLLEGDISLHDIARIFGIE